MPSYITKAIGKVAGIASAVTLGILSYTATPANAAEAPKKFEDPNLVKLVADSYRNAPKGKKRDENIVQFMLGACQDPKVSRADFAYMIHTLPARVSNPQKRKELGVIENMYLETGKKEVAAKAAYAIALNNAVKKRGENRTKALVFAAKTYYNALKKLEPEIEKTQYAEEMLKIAERGLKLARTHIGLVETKNFREYVAESKKAVAQAKKEEHLLSQIIEYDGVIETALTNAEQQRTTAGRILWYGNALKAIKGAEEAIPDTQFGAEKKQLEELIQELKKVTPPPKEKPKPEKPEGGKEKPGKPPETGKPETPLEKLMKEYAPLIEEALEEAEDAGTAKEKLKWYNNALNTLNKAEAILPGDQFGDQITDVEDIIKKIKASPEKFTGSGDKKDEGPSLADVFAGLLGKRYDSFLEFRQGISFEDKDGDNESLYFKFGDVLEFAFLREYLSGRNVADNLNSDQNLSAFLELSPFVVLGLDPEALKIGGILEGLDNTTWKYDETQVNDTATETETETANIKDFINRKFGSIWLDAHIPNLVKIRLAAMLDRTDLITEEDSLTWHENHVDPSASYGEPGSFRTRDIRSKQAISALLGLPFEFLTDDTVKGYFGVRLDHILEKEEFTGSLRNTEEILKLGLMTELYVNNDFGVAALFLQDFAENAGEDTKRAKTYRGQIAAALNLGTISDEKGNPLFQALLLGHGWVTGYKGDVFHGVSGGAVLGNDVVKDISSLVQVLFDKDSSKTGSRVELGDESWNEDIRIRSFLERKGFNNIPIGAIDGKNKYGFALIAYGGVGKAIGVGGRTVTEKFVELSAVLDTPAMALIASTYYADLALERQWGMRFRADIKKGLLRGFAGAIEFNQSRYLLTDELEREIAVAFEIPFGADEDDKDDE